jgi:hypothetical protein
MVYFSIEYDKSIFQLSSIRFDVFTEVTIKNAVFWEVTPWVSCMNRRFGRTYHLHHQDASVASYC